MTISNLLKKSKKYNLLFVSVSDMDEYSVTIEKFYMNKSEYDKFSLDIIKIAGVKTFTYGYYTQKVLLDDFVDMFGLSVSHWEKTEVMDKLNYELRNYAVYFESKENYKVYEEYEPRKKVNEYFENCDYSVDEHFEMSSRSIFNDGIIDGAKLRMYNVGQGGMTALFVDGKEKPTIIFDIGKSRICKSAIDLLSKILVKNEDERTTIIISHYDNDHINMASFLPIHGANLQFIMPEFLSRTDIYKINIQLLIYKVWVNGNNIWLIRNDSINKPVRIGNLSLLQGCSVKKDINQSTNENSHGLISYLTINNRNVLIPGDVLYGDLYTQLNKPLHPYYAIIPHHSCKYISPVNPSIIDLGRIRESFTFCVQHNGFHHPNKTHFQNYINNHSKLIRLVGKEKTYYVFDKSSRIKDTYYTKIVTDYYEWSL